MTQLRVYMNGPTTDYYGIPVSEEARNAKVVSPGTYSLTLANALPATAKGTFAAGIQGYNNVTLLPGTLKEQVARDIGRNKVKYFSVDSSPVVTRRKLVDIAKCNVCHDVLDPGGYLTPIGPAAAACTGCHTSLAAASHALANTSSLGESCSVFHGPNGDFSANKAHAR